jgi:hypothetical protein
MPRLLQLVGILQLEDEEMETLMDIFSDMPQEIMLCSAYIAIKYHTSNIVIPDGVIAELSRIIHTLKTDDKRYGVIDKILAFRSQAAITI